MKNNKILRIAFIALGAALICICSWINVPFVIPFTMQTFGVLAVLGILGGRDGAFSVLLYLAMGCIGLPVFSGFRGGVGVLFGATGGFLFGFVLSALVYALLTEVIFRKNVSAFVQSLSSVAALIVCYAVGTVWYVNIYAGANNASVAGAIMTCVLPFILPDAIKAAGAIMISRRVRRALNVKGGVQ